MRIGLVVAGSVLVLIGLQFLFFIGFWILGLGLVLFIIGLLTSAPSRAQDPQGTHLGALAERIDVIRLWQVHFEERLARLERSLGSPQPPVAPGPPEASRMTPAP